MPVHPARRLPTGFTLIELLIVLVIVGVLTGIAYPVYSGYMKRSARADARAELLRMQLAVEKQRLIRLGSAPTIPANWATASAVARHYQLSLQSNGGQDYTLTATAVPGDAQETDEQSGTSCRALVLQVKASDTRYEPAPCWQN